MKKLLLIITITSILAVSFTGCNKSKQTKAIQEAIRQETSVANVDAIPDKYLHHCDNGGTIEHVGYKTIAYYGTKTEITKYVNVYLPAGYSKKNKYKVLYLMHGIGGTEAEWGLYNDGSFVKRMMDNLIAEGEIEPFIVVCPNGRSSKDFANTNSDFNAFYKFGLELRNDLIPFIDKKYSTVKNRSGRAMAGLSMGGMQTINIGIGECLDLISYFGAFSAAPSSYPASKLADIIKSKSDYPVYYFYNICGLEDNVAYGAAAGAAKSLPKYIASFEEGKNFTWQELHGGHTFSVWYLGFYNFAKIVFTKD